MKIFFKNKTKIILLLIVLLAGFFRLYGLNWDQNQHLHPDERFLTMVLTAIKVPDSFLEYLNPQMSPMSPYNNNYSFFVYGTFPLYLTKIIGVLTENNDYGNIHLVGRILSAFFDVGTVIVLFKIGKKIFSEKIGLFSAFLYAIMVLPIQLSHFFAVDTFLVFFIVLSFYFLINVLNTKYLILNTIFLGASFGLGIACKISSLYFLPIISLGFFFLFLKNLKSLKFLKLLIFSGVLFIFVSLFAFRLAQPTAFSTGSFLNWSLNHQFVKNLKELKVMSRADSWFPPAIQWHSAKPIIFPLKNMILWGMGLPLGITAFLSIIFIIAQLLHSLITRKPKSHNSLFIILNSLIVLWILGLFTYQGMQFVKSMRYFLPIYPFLAITSAFFIFQISSCFNNKFPNKIYILYSLFYLLVLIYPVSFISIYSRPITRVTASKWIYENIPAGSTVTFEEWDDGLPLPLSDYPYNSYKSESLFMYDPDTPEKWQKLNKKIAKVDYYFITSNRAYGPIVRLPKRYPQTTAFYQSLFNESGDFKKSAEFASRPCFPPFGEKHLFCFNDDNAEEAFTVYDHPKVMIFKKISLFNNLKN